MAYVFFNNNPSNKRVGDCAVRAVSRATEQSWTDAYIGLCAEGLAFIDITVQNFSALYHARVRRTFGV